MFYRFQQEENRCIIIEKSTEPLTGENIATNDEDFNLRLYDVFIGHMVDGQILRYTKKLKPVETIEVLFDNIQTERAEAEAEIDFRLSMIELGLV